MFRSFTNVRIIGSSMGISARKENVKHRNCHVFFYKLEGETLYRFGDNELRFSTNNVLFIPEGADFNYEKVGDRDGQYISISFHADHDCPLTPMLICPGSPTEIRKLFIKHRQAFRFGGEIGKIEAYSYFYKLLAIFEKELKNTDDYSVQDNRIDPAVNYLQEHLFDPSLRVSDIHMKCKLSAPTFRKLFERRFSASPKKYVLQQRMAEAKDILRNTEYENIAQVAHMVGFEDQLYFSKCFKSFYGKSPSQYAANQLAVR